MQMPLNDDTTGPKFKRTKRWIIRLYLVLHAFILLTVFVIAGAIFIAFKPDSLSFVTTHLLEPLGIHFSHSEGSLSEGFTLHGVHTEAIDADTLSLDYNLTTILKGQHIIDNITIDGLRIHLDDFIGDSGSSLPLPHFILKSVTLTNLQLISDYPIELDIRAKNGSYDGNRLYFSSVQASIKSRYASGALQGRVKDNILTGDALVYPNAKELHDYVGRFTTLPASQRITIDELSNNRVSLHTAISRLDTVQDPHTSLQNITVGMNYVYDDHYLDFNARYTLIRDQEQMQTSQNLRYALNGVTTSAVKGFITSSHPLPSHLLEGRFRDDAAGFAGKIMLGDTVLSLQSDDYDTFVWNLETVHPHLNFLPYLPEALRHSPFTLSAKGSYTVENQRLIGNVNAHHNHADFNGTLRNEAETFLVQGDLFLLPDAPTWGKWSLKPPSHLELSLNRHHGVTHLNLNADALALSLEQTDHHLKGSGNYLGSYFDISGIQSELHSDVTITSFTPSLWKTLQHIHPIELSKGEYYDAEVRTVTHILYDTALHVSTDIEIPWYAAVLDTQRQYAGVNTTLSLNYSDNHILIDQYRLDIANHIVTSKRPSTLHLDDKGHLIIDEVWIFDALLLNGTVDTDTLTTQLTLHSDRFSYEGPEGEAHVAADLLFTRDEHSVQTLSGHLRLLDGKITYLPLQQFKVMDDDVIIVQDVRPPSTTSLFMNIQVTAQKPLHYLTKELDVLIHPDITLWKESTGPVQILGMLTIPKGSATTSGKEFDIKESHLYFAGGDAINPYLDFTIDHEVDYKKIHIYITHTLDSPIFLFSSDPYMSQNDIMSYLLFGAPAASTLSTGQSSTAMKTDATNFMLGAGVKGLINSATKIQIDTMNILTTQEGGMGFEVGAHLNKDLRVLYKNDTLSSVLVQYQLNRWLRLDADIHELGQGINAIYIKDFRDFLPHNRVQKEKP